MDNGFDKIIPGDGQEELIRAAGRLVQVWESGRHIKCAASRMFSQADLSALRPPPGKFLSHMITMGASDWFGGNRNSDDFREEELLKHHDATFEKYARNYIEHDNNDPRKAVGEIKAARYNPYTHWGEVVMWSDIDKCASQFEKARKGEELHGSMAASISHDVCTACKHASYTPADRCDCILYRKGQWIPEKKAYAKMDNIRPRFKDYSWVGRPADRIAHSRNYLLPALEKAASAGTLRSDQLALALGAHNPLRQVLGKIAEFDSANHENPAKAAAVANLLPRAFEGQWPAELVRSMSEHPYPGRVLKSAAKRDMVMPLATFEAWLSGRDPQTAAADPVVREASDKMASIRIILMNSLDSDAGANLAFNEACQQFNPFSCGCDDIVDKMMDKAREQFACRYEDLAKRACHNPVRLAVPQQHAPSPEALGLGALYNAYLCKFAADSPTDDWMLPALLSALR